MKNFHLMASLSDEWEEWLVAYLGSFSTTLTFLVLFCFFLTEMLIEKLSTLLPIAICRCVAGDLLRVWNHVVKRGKIWSENFCLVCTFQREKFFTPQINSKENSLLIMKPSQTNSLEAVPLLSSLASSSLEASVSVPDTLPDSYFLGDHWCFWVFHGSLKTKGATLGWPPAGWIKDSRA